MDENKNELEDDYSQEKQPKEIEVVTGDGNLNISPVYEHLEVEKPKPKDSREIVIPEIKDTISNTDENSNS